MRGQRLDHGAGEVALDQSERRIVSRDRSPPITAHLHGAGLGGGVPGGVEEAVLGAGHEDVQEQVARVQPPGLLPHEGIH